MSKSEAVKNTEALFVQMSELLEKLIENAKRLKDASGQPIAEDAFEALQKNQATMMQELVELDSSAKKQNLKAKAELQKKIETQLADFQKINREYVEHLRRRLSLIQFSSPMKEEKANTQEPQE